MAGWGLVTGFRFRDAGWRIVGAGASLPGVGNAVRRWALSAWALTRLKQPAEPASGGESRSLRRQGIRRSTAYRPDEFQQALNIRAGYCRKSGLACQRILGGLVLISPGILVITIGAS